MLIPRRNRRHLMLASDVVEAVAQGRFHIHTAEHMGEGLELLSGLPAGERADSGDYPADTLLGRAQKTLQAYRRACQAADSEHHAKNAPRRLR